MLNNHNLSNAINWWTKGLGYLCPAHLRKAFNAFPELITIEVRDQKIILKRFAEDSKETLEIMQFESNNEVERAAALNWLNEQLQHRAEIILSVSDEFFLKKKMVIPKAASSNLRQVLSFEMNRKTPFNAEQVYFDYLLDHHNDETDNIHVELNLVPRNRIEPHLETLDSWNIKLDAIRPIKEYNNPAVNLIPPEEQPRNKSETDKSMLFLVTMVFIMFIAFLYAPVINQQKQLSLLESSITKSRQAAHQFQTLKQNKDKLIEQSHFLKNKRLNDMSSIKLINEVTQIMPDDTWLTRFVIKSGELQLQGESSNASSLVQVLESSEYLVNARFRSPITQNRASNKDRFHLSAEINQKDI